MIAQKIAHFNRRTNYAFLGGMWMNSNFRVKDERKRDLSMPTSVEYEIEWNNTNANYYKSILVFYYL